MTNEEFVLLMKTRGWAMFDAVLEPHFVDALTRDLEAATERCRQVQLQNGLGDDTGGTAHHLVGAGGSLDDLVARCPLVEYVEAWFGGKCILNSFGGFINTPSAHAYVSRVHRDVRPHSGDYPLMVNMLIMLDDFAVENGATYMLSGSQRLPEKPADEFFFKHADRLVGQRGSVALWDSHLWHAAGHNRSGGIRRALTLTITRPFLKQQLDYPRLLGVEYGERLDEKCRQFLGYNARVPGNLDEWYQPPEKRFYKRDQG